MATTYQAKEGFIKRKIAGEILLVPVGKTSQDFNGMIVLNESGDYLWDLLKMPHTREELLAEMQKEFSGDAAEISADLDEFLAQGIQDQLIRTV